MDVDEEEIAPPRLPSFKKANASVAVSSTDSQSTEGDNDMEDAENAIANARLNLKQLDQRILRLQLRAAKHAGSVPDVIAMDLATAKQQRVIQQHMLKELEEATRNLIASSAPAPPVNLSSDNDSEQSYSTVGSSLDASTFAFRRGLPMKLQTHWPRYNGNGQSSAYKFFDDFMRQVRPELGEDRFKVYGPTYLSLLVTNGHFQDQLQKAFGKLEGEVTHDVMEQTFLDVCLTEEERERSVASVTKIGRHKGESYRLFSTRISRIAKQYRIQENNGLILTLLRQCIPAKDMDMVNLRYLYANRDSKAETPDTIEDFCEALGKLTGPDDAKVDYDLTAPIDAKPRDTRRQGQQQERHNGRAKTHFCTKCNAQAHHPTEQHVECDYCHKPGHNERNCYALKNKTPQDGRKDFNNDRGNYRHSNKFEERKRYEPYSRRDDRPRGKDSRPNSGQNGNYHTDADPLIKNHEPVLNELLIPTSPPQINERPITDAEFARTAHLTDYEGIAFKQEKGRQEQHDDNIELSVNDTDVNTFDTVVYNELTTGTTSENRLILPLHFNDKVYDALIDPGATASFIDINVVEEAGLTIKPAQGNIYLGHKRTHVARVGRTEDISIECNGHSLMTSFEVFELNMPFVIGMDLFHRIGLSISGIADGREATKRLPPPIEDEPPSLLPLQTPEGELTDEFKEEKKNFMISISAALEANEKIPRNSHCPLPEMKVQLIVPKGTVLFRRPRRFAEQQQSIFDEQVEKWIKDGVVNLAPAGNPHNNTLTLTRKKDLLGLKTKWRVCLDPRPLNKLLPDDNFPIPLIADILLLIGGHAVYSTIDLTQAYHRLPIQTEHQPFTAFMHNGIQYMFCRAPFGLKPLTSIFQRGMSRILGNLPFVLVFVDDIVIFSKRREDHAEHVRIVIERLTEAKLIINREKSHFFTTQIVLLGFVIDLEGKRVDPNKLANIDQWVPPTTSTQILSYMGTFNFFREFIPLYCTAHLLLLLINYEPQPHRSHLMNMN